MDPLRPFVSLLSSLVRTSATARASKTAARRDADRPPSARTREALHLRLHHRISEIDPEDRKLARDTFVETVLAWEFGDQLLGDPQFSETVRKLSDHIGSQPELDTRLHELLSAMSARPSKP